MKLYGVLVLVGFFNCFGRTECERVKRATKAIKYVTATVGSTVTLRCDTGHDKFDMIKWRKNGSTIPIFMQFQKYKPNTAAHYAGRVELTNRKDLQVENVGQKDQAVYLCETTVLTNEVTTTEHGSPIQLTVQQRPSCRGTPPSFITAVVGSSTLLPCEPVGSPEPKVKWSRNDGTLPTGRYSLTDRGLGIKGVQTGDGGRYQVTLRSEAGTFAHVMELIVRTTSSVLPGNYIDATEDQIARVPCGSGVSEKGASIVWTRDGADATRDPRFTIVASGTLIVNTVKRRDSGVYQCSVRKIQADGSLVTVSHEMYLNVQYLPDILYSKEEVMALEDTIIELPCVAVGNPEVKVSWIRGGLTIKESERFVITANGSLSIQNVTLKEEGYYTCAPYNKLGSGTRRDTLLTVLVSPKFVNQPTEAVTVGYKQNATLDCQSTGKPKPNITWFPVEAKWPYGRVDENEGILTIIETVPHDHGRYRCMVSSIAGSLIRDFVVKISSVPVKPTNLSAVRRGDDVELNWVLSYNGGSKVKFEVWYRPVDLSDHHWKKRLVTNSTSTTVSNISANLENDKFLFAVRARNNNGYGDYSDIIEFTGATGLVVSIGPTISRKPLEPTDMIVNVTKSGYVITWLSIMPPGRPAYTHTVVEMKENDGSSSWKAVAENLPASLRKFKVKLNERDSKLPEFRMYTVAGTVKSSVTYPSKVSVKDVPGKEDGAGGTGAAKTGKGRNSLPAIVLGTMFAVFLIILVISLFCFLRASRRKARDNRGKRAKKVQFDLIRNEYPTQDGDNDSFDGSVFQDKQNGGPILKINGKINGGDRSILKLEGYENEEFRDLLSAEEAKMGVHVILTPNANGTYNTDKRYLTLPNKHNAVSKKGNPKKKLYKSSSSPCVLEGPKATNPEAEKETDITAEEILDEEEYDISDLETDVLGQLNPRFSSMKHTQLLDSYDQFCHSSDFGSKDIVNNTKRKFSDTIKESDVLENNMVIQKKLGSSNRTEKDNEETGTIETETTCQDRGSKENMFDDSNDASSENSVTESERHAAYDVSPLPSPLDVNGDNKPKFMPPSGGLNQVDRFLSQQRHAKLGSIAETRSLESYSKSSGFESGGVSQSSASDGESNLLSGSNGALRFKLKDLESLSDHSARSSPLVGSRKPFFPSISEKGEWDRPPSRTSAQRFAPVSPEKRQFPDLELTDNEELFGRIMDLQRRLGVDLGDSWEDLTDLKPSYCGSRRPVPSSYHDGYTSDVPVSNYASKMNMYSENEKNQRCARLLREFKRRSTSDNESPTPLNEKSVRRSNSSVNDYMRTPPAKVPPVVNQNTSCGKEDAGLNEVVYREWLV